MPRAAGARHAALSDASFEGLEADLRYTFTCRDLLEQAMTHASYAHEQAQPLTSNETFEFLGDAVLGLIVSEYALRAFPQYDEGELTRFRSACVARPSLVKVARTLNLGRHLRVGKGEEQSGGRAKASVLANAVEALIAAIYLDRGFEVTSPVVLQWLELSLGDVMQRGLPRDFKTVLQEHCQKHLGKRPVYNVVSTSGPEHVKQFVVEVQVDAACRATGQGASKKAAEQAAAQAALEQLGLNSAASIG